MVMGRDSCSEGRGFESQHRTLDGHCFVVKITLMFGLKKTENKNEEEAGDGKFLIDEPSKLKLKRTL